MRNLKPTNPNKEIKKQKIITKDLIDVRRQGTGIKPIYFDSVIGKKAKINIEGSDGRAPIHLAIANGNIDIMNLLKKHGAKL